MEGLAGNVVTYRSNHRKEAHLATKQIIHRIVCYILSLNDIKYTKNILFNRNIININILIYIYTVTRRICKLTKNYANTKNYAFTKNYELTENYAITKNHEEEVKIGGAETYVVVKT